MKIIEGGRKEYLGSFSGEHMASNKQSRQHRTEMGFLAQALNGGFVGGMKDPTHRLVLVILVELVNGNTAKVLGQFDKMLVPVVPVGGNLVQKH